MLDGGLCIECLGSQFYDPPTQTCKTCHDSCRSCSGPGQYSCVTCAFPLHLDRLNNQCVPCCASDASPEDQSCCHCDKETGKLVNQFYVMVKGAPVDDAFAASHSLQVAVSTHHRPENGASVPSSNCSSSAKKPPTPAAVATRPKLATPVCDSSSRGLHLRPSLLWPYRDAC